MLFAHRTEQTAYNKACYSHTTGRAVCTQTEHSVHTQNRAHCSHTKRSILFTENSACSSQICRSNLPFTHRTEHVDTQSKAWCSHTEQNILFIHKTEHSVHRQNRVFCSHSKQGILFTRKIGHSVHKQKGHSVHTQNTAFCSHTEETGQLAEKSQARIEWCTYINIHVFPSSSTSITHPPLFPVPNKPCDFCGR